MRNLQDHFDLTDKLWLFLGTISGGAITLFAIKHLSPEQSALVSSVLIACLFFVVSKLTNPRGWWLSIGLIAGIIIGLGSVLSDTMAATRQPLPAQVRYMIVGLQAVSGFVSGLIWGRKKTTAGIPSLGTLLSRLTGITAGLYAIVITVDFLLEGLEEARALSSRLSAATTILVTASIIPGIAGYWIAEARKQV